MNTRFTFLLVLIMLTLLSCTDQTGEPEPWYGISREVRYEPDGGDFVIHDGERRFNRALYGHHTGFRIEAGDLPEFALYLPGMGGNLKWGIHSGGVSKWLTEADQVTARYRPGSMIYEIGDSLLGRGQLVLHLLALPGTEGLILRCQAENIPQGTELSWAFGGASGRKFRRSGDIGADPESSFDLKPAYCEGNTFEIAADSFSLHFGDGRRILGRVPPGASMQRCDAGMQESPAALWVSAPGDAPLLAGKLSLEGPEPLYLMLLHPAGSNALPGLPAYAQAASLFEQAEAARAALAGRIRLQTPDPHINALGGALSIAADAIWEAPSYQHGAVAWRSPLVGWRGAYVADWLGWHDRAGMHFRSYARSQYTEPDSAAHAPDPQTHLSRQIEKAGHSLFSSGYISRRPNRLNAPHHYDMNLVYMDQLLWHFNWTGNLDLAMEMWPVIRRHFQWERRCFDTDADGLYNAYCCIWASDALQYSGGGVTHSSAYNYRGNLLTARLAELIGEDPRPYLEEAEKIRSAADDKLWLPARGWYAEYKDHLGLQRVHPVPGLWTIYHALDAGLADPFQASQCLRYVDHEIPHIPMHVEGLPGEGYYSLSTSNWMPYTWSINSVALAENLHTALAYWQGGRKEDAFLLWKSQLLESMYSGASPGNFQQLSFYDAFRGELYRDFADPVGMAARTLVEGLFGVLPDALDSTLTFRPGLPEHWDSARLELPGLDVAYQRKGSLDSYTIRQGLPVEMDLEFLVEARGCRVASCTVNGGEASWESVAGHVGRPLVRIRAPFREHTQLTITWAGEAPHTVQDLGVAASGDALEVDFGPARLQELYDPQQLCTGIEKDEHRLSFLAGGMQGHRTLFVRLHQEDMDWWQPLHLELREPVSAVSLGLEGDRWLVEVQAHTRWEGRASLEVNGLELPGTFRLRGNTPQVVSIPIHHGHPGTNRILLHTADTTFACQVVEWDLQADPQLSWDMLEMDTAFNDRVDQIFMNEYRSPRAQSPTLQIPLQGIGDWCTFKRLPLIDDSGLRARAGTGEQITLRQGIPLRTPGRAELPNVVYTSRWDNYPSQVSLPLQGKASHAYFLMTGSAHHMQSRMCNGMIRVFYTDGSADSLSLDHPVSWWPIEQDYYEDGHAFRVGAPKPPRILLQSGEQQEGGYQVRRINGTNDIEGGAATVYDLPLDAGRTLESLQLETLANDVVIGLMGISLVRSGEL